MAPGDADEVRGGLADFAAELFESFARRDQRRWGLAYLRGLMTGTGRKSVEPMASRLGADGNRQALAHFITTSPWNPAHVRARLAWRMQDALNPTALIIDDTGFLKDGDASAAVARQYTGTAGKTTNCQVGVSLHLATENASAAINWRLFLPESWDPASDKAHPAKTARRTACQIPPDLGHVPKWQLALDMIDETRSWGIAVPMLIADAGYGDASPFRAGLDERGLAWAVGINGTQVVRGTEAAVAAADPKPTGRPAAPAYAEPAVSARQFIIDLGRTTARPVSWRTGSKPGRGTATGKRMYSRFVAVRIRPGGRARTTGGREATACWLLAEWPAKATGPVQFWLSNLPDDTTLPTLVRTCKLRWRIEHDYREMKQALGLAHFEGRTFPGWHHHVTLVAAAHAFATLQRLERAPKDPAPDAG